ncbi:hypothetical protein HOG16_03830 [Candidatus Woesearchaeota archaeon]|jgi:hypothetical protein|nr:hypothetical protein [Candidatus Woesearchaeota archaeon]MBT4321891.1 hypothetical protein [Candidatus Woesearchaeota archaeon]
MQENIKRDIISVLQKTIVAIKKQNLAKLRDQSNKTVHNSSIYQDKYSISISVVVFTILKILEKSKYDEGSNITKKQKIITSELIKAKKALKKENFHEFSKSLKKIIFLLKKLDKDTGRFIQEAVESSKVKKAYGIYRHGVSAGKAAELLGISRWELQPYLGHTRESEYKLSISKTIEERIKITKEIFNIK